MMNVLKLNLIALVSILTLGINFAKTEVEHAIITQNSDNEITLRAFSESNHPLKIEFTNNEGNIVFSEDIYPNEMILKTYDLSKTKVGEYNVAVYCKDKNFASTFVSKSGVAKDISHKIYLD